MDEPADVRVAKFNNNRDIPEKLVVFYLSGESESDTVQILEIYIYTTPNKMFQWFVNASLAMVL